MDPFLEPTLNSYANNNVSPIENQSVLIHTIPDAIKVQMRVVPTEPCVFQVPLSTYPYQPWAKHANPSAWFNQNMNAELWTEYSVFQQRLKQALIQEQQKQK